MMKLDQKKETCPCRVCKSDLAYVAQCDFADAIEFERIFTEEEIAELLALHEEKTEIVKTVKGK